MSISSAQAHSSSAAAEAITARVMRLLRQQPEHTRVVLPARDAGRERAVHAPLCLTELHLLGLTVCRGVLRVCARCLAYRGPGSSFLRSPRDAFLRLT